MSDTKSEPGAAKPNGGTVPAGRPAPKRLMVEAATKLHLPRHIKLRHDPGRGRWLILAPERVFEPDEIAVEVLKRLDGAKSVDDVAGELAVEYTAPKPDILADVISMLQDLADRGVVKA